MKLPTNVQKQHDDAVKDWEAQQAQLNNPSDEEPGEPAPEQKTAEPESAPAKAEPQEKRKPTTVSIKKFEALEKKLEEMENRWKGMKKHHDETVAKHKEELEKAKSEGSADNELFETLNRRLEALESENEQLRQSSYNKQSGSDLLSEEEREYMDPDMLRVMEKIAQNAAQGVAQNFSNPNQDKFDEISGKVNTLSENFNQIRETSEKTSYESFIDQLTDRVPAWENMQKHADFEGFWHEYWPAAQQSHGALIEGAVQARDYKAAADLYMKFAERNGLSAQTGEPQSPLENMVEPDTGGTGFDEGQETDPINKRLIPESELKAFYDGQTNGQLRMSREDIARRNAEYQQAAREGRIIPGK